MVVVVTIESNMASYFSEEIEMALVMLTCVLKWLGRRVAAPAICLTSDLALNAVLLLFPPLLELLDAMLNLSVTATPIPPFGACYVIMHKVYFKGAYH